VTLGVVLIAVIQHVLDLMVHALVTVNVILARNLAAAMWAGWAMVVMCPRVPAPRLVVDL